MPFQDVDPFDNGGLDDHHDVGMIVGIEIFHLDLFIADPGIFPGRDEHAVGQVLVIVEGLDEFALHFCGLGKGIGNIPGFLVHDHPLVQTVISVTLAINHPPSI